MLGLGGVNFPVGQCWGRQLSERQPAVASVADAFSRTRLSASTSWWCSSVRLAVLPCWAAGSWGLQIFLRTAGTHRRGLAGLASTLLAG